MTDVLSKKELEAMNAYWRATNYLSVGQIYLYDNPLLKEPLTLDHIKPRLLGHWGTTPGLNFIYVHLNRAIKEHGLNVIVENHGGISSNGEDDVAHVGHTVPVAIVVRHGLVLDARR